MYLPHFDRPSSRPPEGIFRFNRDSPQADGLVGWWPTLASRGGNMLMDFVGANNAPFSGDLSWSNHPEIGPLVRCPGSADYASMGDADEFSINATGELSVFAWASADQTNSRDAMVSKGAASNYEWELLFNNNATARALIYQADGSTYLIASGGSYAAGIMGHYGFTCILTTEVRCYVNGIDVANDVSTDGSYAAGTAAVQIGERDDGGNDHTGHTGEVRIYNRSLSASEVWNLYAPETRWDLYQPVPRIWPAIAAAPPPSTILPWAQQILSQQRRTQ